MDTQIQGASAEANYYATRYVQNPHRDLVWQHITNYLYPKFGLATEATVLELGTGYGSWIRSFLKKGRHTCHALDINSDLPQLFKAVGIQGIKTHVGSCSNLKIFSNQSVDLILASNLLEHFSIEEATECLMEARRVLKPGGKICIVQPNFRLCYKEYFDDYTHRTIFTDKSLADFVQANGFNVLHQWNRFLPFSMKGSSGSLSFLVPFYLRSPVKPFAGQMAFIAQKPEHH